jgi:hypothetical protein
MPAAPAVAEKVLQFDGSLLFHAMVRVSRTTANSLAANS